MSFWGLLTIVLDFVNTNHSRLTVWSLVNELAFILSDSFTENIFVHVKVILNKLNWFVASTYCLTYIL